MKRETFTAEVYRVPRPGSPSGFGLMEELQLNLAFVSTRRNRFRCLRVRRRREVVATP